jgi:hypothetical protein
MHYRREVMDELRGFAEYEFYHQEDSEIDALYEDFFKSTDISLAAYKLFREFDDDL